MEKQLRIGPRAVPGEAPLDHSGEHRVRIPRAGEGLAVARHQVADDEMVVELIVDALRMRGEDDEDELREERPADQPAVRRASIAHQDAPAVTRGLQEEAGIGQRSKQHGRGADEERGAPREARQRESDGDRARDRKPETCGQRDAPSIFERARNCVEHHRGAAPLPRSRGKHSR